MKDSIKRMRPMGIADILDETVELYKTSFALLMGIAAVLYVPYSVLTQYFTMKYSPHFDPANPGPPNTANMLAYIGALALGLLWMLVASPFVTGAMTFAISERFLNSPVSVVKSFQRVLRIEVFSRILVYVLITFGISLVTIGVIAGLIAACVFVGVANTTALFAAIPIALILSLGAVFGAMYLCLRLVLVDCIIVVEMKTIGESLARGWNLMPGSMLKCFALLFLAGLVVGVVQSMAVQPTAWVISMNQLKTGHTPELLLIIHTLLAAVSSTLLAPVTSIVTILLYYDIRIRKEGFDLELLAAELHASANQTPAWAGQPLPREQAPMPITQEIPASQPPPEDPRQP